MALPCPALPCPHDMDRYGGRDLETLEMRSDKMPMINEPRIDVDDCDRDMDRYCPR